MVQLGLELLDLLRGQPGALPEEPLRHGDGERCRVLRDVAGDLERGGEHLLPRYGAQRQTHLGRLATGDPLAGEQEPRGALHAHDAGQGPVRAGVRHDPAPHLQDAVLRVVGGDAQVALQGERQAQADGVAVHATDDGLAHLPRRRLDRRGAEPGSLLTRERLGARAQIGAHAERLARTGEHDGAHAVVAVAARERVSELFPHATAERVAVFGAMQGDHGDARVEREADVLVVHRARSYPSAGCRLPVP